MKTRKIIMAVVVLGIFVFFGFDALQKEKLLKNGRLVYFDSRSRDPRSLMQGDYMRLNYNIERDISDALHDSIAAAASGELAVISPDSNSVVRFVRLYKRGQPLHDTEMIYRFKLRGKWARVGPKSYMFEEGTAECFSTARYIAMRVDDEGNALLASLHDWDFCRLHEMDTATYRLWINGHKPEPRRAPGRD